MEISDVVKIRNLLRSATRTITVYDKDTNESLGEKEVPNPITVELDNSLGISEEVDNVLKMRHYKILEGKGKISKLEADKKASKEYEKFKVRQDRSYISDFDKLTLETKKIDNKK